VAFSKKGQTPPGMHSVTSSQAHSNNSEEHSAHPDKNQRQFYSWQRPGIDISTDPYCLLPLAPPPPQPSNSQQSQHHMSCGTNAGTTHQLHYHYHAAPPIPRRLPGQAPYPIRISPSFLACSEYLPSDTYATRTHKPNCNHYRPTPHPRRLPPSCLTPTC